MLRPITSGQIDLEAGVRYDIRMEYYEAGGAAVAQLRWASASQSLEVVPESQLYAATDLGPDPGDSLQAQTVLTGNRSTDLDRFLARWSQHVYLAEERSSSGQS